MDCSICLEKIRKGRAELSCKHKYHLRCIVQWMTSQSVEYETNTCPLCRTETLDYEKIPLAIIKQKFVCGYKEEINKFLKRWGGRGLSNTTWKTFENQECKVIENSLVLSEEELQMLMIMNGCKSILLKDDFESIHDSHSWEI